MVTAWSADVLLTSIEPMPSTSTRTRSPWKQRSTGRELPGEKLVAEGGKPQPDKELKERLKVADEVAAKYKKENKSKKVVAEGKAPSVEKIEAAIAKLTASDAEMDNARDATQILGGNGFMNEYPVARHYRDSKILEIGEGTSEVQLLVISRALGLG